MDERKRVLILTADAGFGHRAAANAIASALRELYENACDVRISNPMSDPRTPAFLQKTEKDYDIHVSKMREMYRLTYKASDWDLPVSFAEAGLMVLLYSVLKDTLAEHRPDAIASTHPYYPAALASVFALSRHYIPVLAAVTDLATVHSVWFNESVDIYAVPTDIVAAKALESRIPKDRIRITGLPINPALARTADKAALREQLGWPQDRYTVLMVGGKRVKKIAPVAPALNHSVLPVHLALVTGGDEELLQRWRQVDWQLPVHLYGFAENMATLMLASDMIVCKAGGLIVSEALAAGLPLLLVEAIPGQETGNADYIIQAGAGELVSEPLGVLACLMSWLDRDGALLAARAANAHKIGRPKAALDVARLVWHLVEHGVQPREHPLVAQAAQLREMLVRMEWRKGKSSL